MPHGTLYDSHGALWRLVEGNQNFQFYSIFERNDDMIIRCYGSRGSTPVSGEEYNRYGGDTTCLEIRSKNDHIIVVDAGTGIRRLGERLCGEKRYDFTLIFTHSHLDHIIGFPFFKPIYHEKTAINLMGCPTTQGNMKTLLAKAMDAPIFPVPFNHLKAKIDYAVECKINFQIDSIEIFTINLSHPNGGMGYSFVEEGKKFVFLTDNELSYRHRNGRTFEDYAEFSKDADLLVHDAQFTEEEYKATRTWGHSTYLEALNLAITAQVKRFALFHHDPGRTDFQLEALLQNCREILDKKKINMECFALRQDAELNL